MTDECGCVRAAEAGALAKSDMATAEIASLVGVFILSELLSDRPQNAKRCLTSG
jgi:hypothetical protein